MTAPLADIAIRERLSVDVQYFTLQAISCTPQDLQTLSSSILLTFTAPPITGEDILTQTRAASHIPSSCASLNRILSGGLHLGEWLELVGEPSAGKTQVWLGCCIFNCLILLLAVLVLGV